MRGVQGGVEIVDAKVHADVLLKLQAGQHQHQRGDADAGADDAPDKRPLVPGRSGAGPTRGSAGASAVASLIASEPDARGSDGARGFSSSTASAPVARDSAGVSLLMFATQHGFREAGRQP